MNDKTIAGEKVKKQLIRSFADMFDIVNGKRPHESNIHEEISEWRKLAEETENEHKQH
jgi:hypothetical protein